MVPLRNVDCIFIIGFEMHNEMQWNRNKDKRMFLKAEIASSILSTML